MVSAHKNVVMTRDILKNLWSCWFAHWLDLRTFEIIDALNRVRGPSMSMLFAIGSWYGCDCDKKHIEEAIDHNLNWLEKVAHELTDIGLDVTPSVVNFVLN